VLTTVTAILTAISVGPVTTFAPTNTLVTPHTGSGLAARTKTPFINKVKDTDKHENADKENDHRSSTGEVVTTPL
jgi:hypothetical protein